jgi:CTP:molybdopterin cytidylyltransferase MocA
LIAAAVLAAGGGERFGGDVPKPLVPFRGRPLVAHALDAATASGLAPVLLVVGNAADAVAAASSTMVANETVVLVRNDDWRTGIASSLVAALRALRERTDVDGVVVGLADQPLVGPAAYRRLARAYDDGARLAVATYAGARGNPVLLAREHWDEAAALTGDEGARVLMRTHPVVEVPCDGTGSPTDVDTPADLEALEG